MQNEKEHLAYLNDELEKQNKIFSQARKSIDDFTAQYVSLYCKCDTANNNGIGSFPPSPHTQEAYSPDLSS